MAKKTKKSSAQAARRPWCRRRAAHNARPRPRQRLQGSRAGGLSALLRRTTPAPSSTLRKGAVSFLLALVRTQLTSYQIPRSMVHSHAKQRGCHSEGATDVNQSVTIIWARPRNPFDAAGRRLSRIEPATRKAG